MSDDHFAPQEPEVWRKKLQHPPAPFNLTTALWFTIGAISLPPMIVALLASDMSIDDRFAIFSAGIVLLLSCTIGLKLNWGPVIPCVILFPIFGCMCCPMLNPGPKTLIDLSIFRAILGGGVGLLIEQLTGSSSSRQRRHRLRHD